MGVRVRARVAGAGRAIWNRASGEPGVGSGGGGEEDGLSGSGAARAVNEVKGDIVNLYFYDRLLNDTDAVKGSSRPEIKLIFDSVADELIPVLKAIVPRGSETQNFVDYTSSNILRRPGVLAKFPDESLPATLLFTLHDDNVGVLPQLTAGSLHGLSTEMKRYGWAGFTTRYWLIGDHDRTVSYLARTSWEQAISPDEVSRDQNKQESAGAAASKTC